MEQTKQLTVQQFFKQPNVSAKFSELLKENAPEFITSVIQIASSNDMLKKAIPESIFNAALMAATLKLPISNALGQAYIVPYNETKDGSTICKAQFQIGYLGFIQLAMRTNQYKKLNVIEVHENQFTSWNELSEELIGDFTKTGNGKIVGYACAFMLLNGFTKISFWNVEKMTAHFEKFSKMYKIDKFKRIGFAPMALKTALKNTLKKWGVLSIELQKALITDQAEILNPDKNEVNYLDNPQRQTPETKQTDIPFKPTFEDLKVLIESAHHVFTVKEQADMLDIYEKSTEDTLEFDYKYVEKMINDWENAEFAKEEEKIKHAKLG